MLATKTTLTLEAAKAIAAAAEAESKRLGLQLVIAIVDDGGHIVLLQRDDHAMEIVFNRRRHTVFLRHNQ